MVTLFTVTTSILGEVKMESTRIQLVGEVVDDIRDDAVPGIVQIDLPIIRVETEFGIPFMEELCEKFGFTYGETEPILEGIYDLIMVKCIGENMKIARQKYRQHHRCH